MCISSIYSDFRATMSKYNALDFKLKGSTKCKCSEATKLLPETH